MIRKQEIQSIGEVFNGKTPSKEEQHSSGQPILKIRDIDEVGQFRGAFESFVDQAFYHKHAKKKLNAGDTIILNAAHNADYVGSKNAFVPAELNGVIATGEWLIVRVKEANPKYVNQYLKSPSGRKSLKNCVKGIHLYPKDVERINVPLPALDDQIRIAHLLGKVEELITQRKQLLQQFDNLLKSVFLEMFGDPVRNEKEWAIQPCNKAVLNISSGTSYGGEERPFANDDEVGVLKISAVTKGTFDPAEFKIVNKAQITKTLRFVKRGDFLFSRANTVELVAACCVVPQDYARLFLPDKLWVLTLNTQLVNPQFFNYLLKNERYRNAVRNLASGGHDSMLNISMKRFMTLGIPCPFISLQNQFAAIVEKVSHIQTLYQQSLTDLQSLYGALSQQAFKGELDLKRIHLISDNKNGSGKKISIESFASVRTSPVVAAQLVVDGALDHVDLRNTLTKEIFNAYLSNKSGETLTANNMFAELMQLFSVNSNQFETFIKILVSTLEENSPKIEQVFHAGKICMRVKNAD